MLCDVTSKELFWLPNVPSPSVFPQKKYNSVFNKAKASAQSFCFIVFWSLSLLRAPVATRSTWLCAPGWERTGTHGASVVSK